MAARVLKPDIQCLYLSPHMWTSLGKKKKRAPTHVMGNSLSNLQNAKDLTGIQLASSGK